MALGVGIDILSIDRMKDAMETGGKVFLDRVFTAQEQQAAKTRDNPMTYLALAFAGKEAVFKAFAADWETGVQLTDIEIRYMDSGAPFPVLTGKFAELGSQWGVAKVLLSLSYDGGYVIAISILV